MIKLYTRYSKCKILSILLVAWIYIYALFYFVPLIVPSSTLLMYILLLFFDIIIFSTNRNFPTGILKFLLAYILVVLFNILAVSYKYYVIIDAFSGMAVFLPALLIISSPQFELDEFLKEWYRLAIIVTVISPIAIILVQYKRIDYGVFTYLNLPNSIVLAFYFMILEKGERSKKVSFLFAVLNCLIILAFGGRMAGFVAALAIFLGYMLSTSVRLIKKVFIIFLMGSIGILIISNLYIILQYVQKLLMIFNLNSRSISLLIEQVSNGTGIYMTRRNVIYEEIVQYIKNRVGLPGGFGVSLYVSNGQFYHPHNLALQLAVMFGIVGEVIIVVLIFWRLSKIKRNYQLFEYQFTLLILIEYLVLSLTGGSILNNFIAIIGIGMLFFYKGTHSQLPGSGDN